MARASGGVLFYSSSNLTAGVTLPPGSGSWSSLSDRNAKENLQPVNPREVLRKVAALPLASWNYKAQGATVRHIGPMAQDFQAAFRVGEDDRHISGVDADGVALAAIQGLHQQLQELLRLKNAQIETLERRNQSLEQRVQNLEELLGYAVPSTTH